MKKSAYLFLMILSAVFIFSGCGKKVNNNNIPSSGQNNMAAEEEESENTKMSASVKEMMKSGKSLECTFSFTDVEQGAAQSGKLYVDGARSRFRSEIEVTTNSTGVKSKAYMITDGDYGYSWSDVGPKTGVKFNLNESSAVSSTDKNGQNTEDLDQRIDFDCHKWSVDNSKFEIPANIVFTDFEQMMKSLSVPTGAANIDVCSICDQIPDAAVKAECQKTNCK